MRRPPSYSDSYVVLSGGVGLAPLVTVPSIQSIPDAFVPEPPLAQTNSWNRRISIFVLKSSIHVFLISLFETVFFFEYVSVSENNGILKTINTYYGPLQESCYGWPNSTKWLIQEFLDLEFNQTIVDAESQEAITNRTQFNRFLLHESLSVSAICFVVFSTLAAFLKWYQVPVPWKEVLVENLMMVVLLGLYEYFFFRKIIYNYDTLSTPELNAYILDGLWACTSG